MSSSVVAGQPSFLAKHWMHPKNLLPAALKTCSNYVRLDWYLAQI